MWWILALFAAIWVIGRLSITPASDLLADCVAETEEIRLLREISLPSKSKEMYKFCIENMGQPEACEAQYLNAESPVRRCMVRGGYTFVFSDNCDYRRWRSNSECYSQTWLVKTHDFLAKNPAKHH